jgi:hypothetical protein
MQKSSYLSRNIITEYLKNVLQTRKNEQRNKRERIALLKKTKNTCVEKKWKFENARQTVANSTTNVLKIFSLRLEKTRQS